MNGERIEDIPLERVVCDGNARSQSNAAADEELDRSMTADGQFTPIFSYESDDRYVAVDGGRRVRSARRLGWKTIKSIVLPKPLNRLDSLTFQSTVNTVRCNLQLMERADSLAEMRSLTGWSISELAERRKMSIGLVSKLLALPQLPETIRDLIQGGRIGLSMAYELSKIEDPVTQFERAIQAANGKLTRETVAANRRAPTRSARKGSVSKRAVALLGDGHSVTVNGTGDLDEFIAMLAVVVSRAKGARTKGHSLATFCKTLRDEAKVGGNEGAKP